MDANGNLTEIVEFTQFRRFRLISYLDPDCAIGITLLPSGDGVATISRISSDKPENSIFLGGGAGDSFFLQWDPNRELYLCGNVGTQQLFTQGKGVYAEPSVYTIRFVDGCWFNLVMGPDTVVDCAGSNGDQGNPILWWDANGGDNQKWRATTIGIGLEYPNMEPK